MAPTNDGPPNPDRPAAATGDLRSDVRLLDYKFDQLDKKFDQITTKLENAYATKSELSDVREDVNAIKAQLGWAIKLVVGAIITAVIGIVLVKGGVPHP